MKVADKEIEGGYNVLRIPPFQAIGHTQEQPKHVGCEASLFVRAQVINCSRLRPQEPQQQIHVLATVVGLFL